MRSYTTLFAVSARATRAPASAAAGRRTFVSSRPVFGKESDLHNENRAPEAEQQKQEQLKKQKEGKGEWNEDLASDSESIVKADKGELNSSGETIKQLQDETAKLAEKEQK